MNTLVTSALPYINGVKHLGNLAGSLLPADVHARFLRQAGEDVAFICATDEHGTPAELGAAAAGVPVRAYCDRQHRVQAELYRRFDLSFDHFGRTSSPANHECTVRLYRALDKAGFLEERVVDQVWSSSDGRFLPDRYVEGRCPHCGATARGDQCEGCSSPLDPTDLLEARSAISGATDLEVRSTRHLYLRQSALADRIGKWLDTRRGWPAQVLGIARGWLAAGLEDRSITRDLEWGVPVPRPGFEGKVFYVWFDAPIGYLAATTEWCEATGRDVDDWWHAGADARHVQFLAKDNVPFHAITFPATLLGSGLPLRTADVVKGVNWLLHDGGKFSTSGRRGVFLDEALDVASADQWRWWLAANCPETSDADFSFERFATGVNADLADNLGNLAGRVLSYVAARRAGEVPRSGADGPDEEILHAELHRRLAALEEAHRAIEIRRAAGVVRSIWSLANAYVANQAPWTLDRTDPDRADVVLRNAVGLVRVAATCVHPFAPALASRLLALVGEAAVPGWTTDPVVALGAAPTVRIERPAPLVAKLDDRWVAEQAARFGGT